MMVDRIAGIDAVDAAGFGYGEHLLVWSWRRIATGRAHCSLMAHEFSDTFGDDAREVFATFCTFLQALAFASRRQLTIGPPGCLAVTADERRVLTLIAAAQAETPALFEAHLCWLTGAERRHVLKIAAGALATAFAANDLRLALPAIAAPIACVRSLAVV